MIAAGLLSKLACPRDGTSLRQEGRSLACERGHAFPVVDDIPVLLLDDKQRTISLADCSMAAAAKWSSAGMDPPQSELFLDTLGVSEEEKAEATRLARGGEGGVDPAVSVLIAATNGVAYKHLVAKLDRYPIPEIRLPEGDGKALLDLGCSWGRWSIAAARKGYRVVGVDPSLGAVAAARRAARQLGSDIDVVCADARYLPFRDASFDRVFSYSVIQHFSKPDAKTAFAEASRVLAAGGSSLIQMPNARGVRSLYQRLRRGFSEGEGFEVRYWTVPELERAFAPHFARVDTSVHCYFGLGLEASDAAIVSMRTRALIAVSERLRMWSMRVGALRFVADSVYVDAHKG